MNPTDDFNPVHIRSRMERFIDQEKLFHATQPLLLAISGGLDSVVLSHLLHDLGHKIVLAHCNFGLRGEESDADEAFVRGWALRLECPVHTVRFETESYRKTHRLSIQVAARVLRYQWLEELRGNLSKADPSRKFRLITAHHQDDNIETMLLHFFRGTGISGMRGMLPSTPAVARPLLFACREELESYARVHDLTWREDRSNAEDKYDRNFLRLRVLPLIAERFPTVKQNLAANLHRFRETEAIRDLSMRPILRKLVSTDASGLIRIPVEGLRSTGFAESILWDVIQGLEFTAAQVSEAMRLLDLPSGRWLASGSHRIVRHRNWLLIHPLNAASTPVFVLEEASGILDFPEGTLKWEISECTDEKLPRDADTAWIDLEEIRFPIILRRWGRGDYFYPLGMMKKKKIARFLIDEKTSLPEKDRTWILESDRRILWIVGKRIDGRFQVRPGTNKILKINFLHQD
jgi:tRNA(Ile)-lysidine synthase